MLKGKRVISSLILIFCSLGFGDPPKPPNKLDLELPKEKMQAIVEGCHCELNQNSPDNVRNTAHGMLLSFKNPKKYHIAHRSFSVDTSEAYTVGVGKIGHTGANGVVVTYKLPPPKSSGGKVDEIRPPDPSNK